MNTEKEHKLTDKQRAFCNEYLIDLNATQAAIRAGYSEDTAKQIGCENLSKLYLREYIDKQINIGLSNRKTELKRKIIEELEMEAFGEGEIITDKDGNPVSVRKSDKIKSLELLGKYTTLFTDKVEVQHTGVIFLDKQDEDL